MKMNFSFFMCFSVLLLFSIIEVGNSLDCFHCNVTSGMMSTAGYDPCAGVAKLQKCQDPAVCIAATYSYKDSSSPGITATLKSCYPDMAGTECVNFMKNVKNINHASPQMAFSESCVTCTTHGCNHTPKPPSINPQQSHTHQASDATVFSISITALAFASLVTRMMS